MTRSTTPRSSSSSWSASRPSTAPPARPSAFSSMSRPPRSSGRRTSSSCSGSPRPQLRDAPLESDEVTPRQAFQQRQVRPRRNSQRPEQPAVEGAVANSEAMPPQPHLVERGQRERHHLGVALGPGHSDQLQTALQELARLPHATVRRAPRAGEVAEPDGRLDTSITRRDHPRDGDRHVGAQREHVALLVECAVASAGRALLPAAQHLLVLERGRVDLPVTGVLEADAHALADLAQLAHLVGQHVASARRDRVRHGPAFVALRKHALAGDRARCARPAPAAARRCARSRGRSA